MSELASAAAKPSPKAQYPPCIDTPLMPRVMRDGDIRNGKDGLSDHGGNFPVLLQQQHKASADATSCVGCAKLEFEMEEEQASFGLLPAAEVG